jgi:hypothetical protein
MALFVVVETLESVIPNLTVPVALSVSFLSQAENINMISKTLRKILPVNTSE